MREFKRIYYTLLDEQAIEGFAPGVTPGTSDVFVSLPLSGSATIGNYLVCLNRVYVLTDVDGFAETVTGDLVGAFEDKGTPAQGDIAYLIDESEYFDAWVNRTITTEHAFYSNFYQQYNSITTERVVVESYGTWVFSDTGTTDGGYELLKDINQSKLMVLGDCGGNNYAKKIVYDNTATGRATNNRVKYGFIARVIA